MARPIILGVVGDSAAGKTTLTRGLVRDPRRGARHARLRSTTTTATTASSAPSARSRRSIPTATTWTSWRSTCGTCGAGEPFLKPVYRHTDGTFGPPTYVEPQQFAVVEGLLGYYTDELRGLYDVRVFLAPPEELRRKWKVAARLLAPRLHDRPGARRARPARARLRGVHPPAAAARRHRRLVPARRRRRRRSTSTPSCSCAPDLPHPDLSPFVDDGAAASRSRIAASERRVRIPGDVDPESARGDRGGDLGADALRAPPAHRAPRRVHRRHRAPALGVAGDRPVLVLYHLVTAKATVALGGDGARQRPGGRRGVAP